MQSIETGLRPAVAQFLSVALAAVVMIGLTACSSSSGSASTTVSSTTLATTVVTDTVDRTVVNTYLVTSTSDVTRTHDAATTSHPSGSISSSTTPAGTCPEAGTLTGTLPAVADRDVPVNQIRCSGDWAVGNYSQGGMDENVGIFQQSGGSWEFQDRETVCAAADQLPPELYTQACTTD